MSENTENKEQGQAQGKFAPDMTIGAAMALHPRAKEVFAGFHLGGCSHCGIAEFETIGQVCEGYGVPVEQLLGVLNGLLEEETAKA
jgi:hybrid cluster-associated redox disulfide protein